MIFLVDQEGLYNSGENKIQYICKYFYVKNTRKLECKGKRHLGMNYTQVPFPLTTFGRLLFFYTAGVNSIVRPSAAMMR